MKNIIENELNLEEICQIGFSNLHQATATPGFHIGIYLLWYKDEIVYVGKSVTSLFKRIFNHSSGQGFPGMKLFDKITFYGPNLTKSDIHILEVYLINLYKPKYNSDSNATDIISIKVVIPEIIENTSITFDYYSYALRLMMNESRGENIKIKKATNHNPLTYEKINR